MQTPQNTLEVLPSFRAIRQSQDKASDGFLPRFCTLEEFFKLSKYVADKKPASSIVRKILLREASLNIPGTPELGFEKEFLQFLRNNDFLFRFFDELIAEDVEFNKLLLSDTYAKFEDHLSVLQAVWQDYCKLLDRHGLFDTSHPKNFAINRTFITSFDEITVHLGGYASFKEIKILNETAMLTNLFVFITLNDNNLRMKQRLIALGFNIGGNGHYKLSWNNKTAMRIDYASRNTQKNIYAVSRRIDAAVTALDIATTWINNGASPEKIAIILADENFAPLLQTLDLKRNLNFAMGIKNSQPSAILDAILEDNESAQVIYASLNIKPPANHDELFELLSDYKECEDAIASAKTALEYAKTLSIKDMAYIILSEMSNEDDVGGGKITVTGLLETRGVDFDGTIFLDFSDEFAPKPSQKDLFLTSDIRKRAGLPTRSDREGLQAYYYEKALEASKYAAFIYCGTPSMFAKILNLPTAIEINEASTKYFSIGAQQESTIEPQTVDLTTIEWSSTKLKTFLTCNRKFYLKYILKIQDSDPLIPKTAAQILGEKFHEVIKLNPNMDKKEIFRRLSAGVSDKLLLLEFQKIYLKLDFYCDTQKRIIADGYKTIYTEKTTHFRIGDFNFISIFDRVDENKGKFLIIDYKLGQNVKLDLPKDETKRTDYQLPIYALALQHEIAPNNANFIENDVKAMLLAVNDEKILTEDNLVQSCEQLVRKIQDLPKIVSEFAQCEKSAPCRFCAYKILCEKQQ